uniref:Translation initiation factor eIF2B subunit beta n=1 Tax=Brassica oleracea var. oleracea TaxID=109376 RepID=A0A0D3BA52_BRAOL
MISLVNTVIIGAHAVMANGGVIGPVGVNIAALEAKKHAVPFVVLAGSHKIWFKVVYFVQSSDCSHVIIGAHAVMANGGVIGPGGVNMAALKAKKACSPICGSSW